MNLKEFCKQSRLFDQKEPDKVRLLAFFHHKTGGQVEFTKDDIVKWFDELHLSIPNLSRLFSTIRTSSAFIRGKSDSSFRLHAVELDELQAQYPGLHSGSEEVVSDETVLPRKLYEGTRGFIESLSKQINASYEYNIYDGCAVLMRRLLEVLLILSCEHNNQEGEVRDPDGNYLPLEKIIAKARANQVLKLSRDTKATLDEFRTLGNYSAHKIYYNCRRADLKNILTNYRATVEELLYKSGIKT